MSGWSIGAAVVSIAVSQIIRVATAPSQLKTQTNVTEDQSDTGVSSGKYGEPIAVFWGSGRAPGNLIWAKEIREQVDVTSETVTQSGGKGGGGGAATTTTTTKYTYFGTFALEICANEIIGVSKMWLNSKLFYENRPFLLGTPLAASQEAQQYFTIYPGGPSQIQDPTISAAVGAALTPGYTNRAIIVFKELPLLDFGNRFPIVEVMYHQDGSGDNLHTVAGSSTKLHRIAGYLCDKVGLLPSQIDVTELTDDVEGFSMSQRGNAQGFLRELAQVYHFGCIDTGQKLKFVSHPVPVYREEYEQNCIINEDFLIVNSYHDVLGRSGYFPSSCGTSEGQFAQIIASVRAYQATNDIYWHDLALAMAESLSRIYFAEPPASPTTLYTPHWLFNVKRNIQLQSSVLTTKVIVYRLGDGSYYGLIPAGPGFYGDLVTKITRVYDNTHSYLVWKNPYSGVRGVSYGLPSSIMVNTDGCHIYYPVDYFGTSPGLKLNFAYVINAGKTLGVSEMMEAWPHWREIEGGEIDCAVDTLAWALDAFDLLYTMTSNSKWLNAANATKQTIQTVYAVDDGRWWIKKAKGSAFVLSGTYLAADGAPFSEGQLTRNKDLTLEFAVTEDGAFSGVTPLPLATLQSYWYGISTASTASVVNTYASTEIQFGRGINDTIRAGDTAIRLIAKCSSSTMVCRVFLQDKDDDLLTTFRWYSDITLTTTLATYDLPLSGFQKMQYPFNGSTNLLGTGISSGQVIKVAGIIFYPTQNCNITVQALRPIPEVTLPYTPSVAPYTANSLGGQILDWAGGPGIGYQNCWVWSKIGNTTRLAQQVGFLVDSQNSYTTSYGVVGPFKPAYVWDRYDVLEIGGTPNTWQWAWPDPNSEWVGYTARCVEGLARAAFVSGNTTARTVAGGFLSWLNTNWTLITKYIPTNYPSIIPSRANSTSYTDNELAKPATSNGFVYRTTNAGISGASVPSFPTTIGATVVDGGVTWRCSGYAYSDAIYGEYHEPHAAALFLRAAAWYRLAGGSTSLADSLVTRLWNYMESLVVTTGPMAGTWSPNVSGQEWWGFWGAEIITTLSLLLTDHAAVRTANGISSTTIQTRINNYKLWVFNNTRTITIPDIDDVVTKEGYSVSTIQDIELPNEVIIKYKNLKNSGEGESRYFRKQSGYSDASVNLSLNMTLTAEQAGNLPKTIVGEFWSQRDIWEFKTRSLTAQPMDCREFMVDGEVKRLLYKNVELSPNGESKITAVSYDPTVYRISAPTPSEGVAAVVSLSYPPQTIVTILNLPAMSPADNTPGYASGASAGTDKWQGGSLTASNDGGLSFTGEALYGARMTSGTIAEVLPANRISVIDRSMSLTVSLEYGQLESITEAQLLNRGNIALMGSEIICFQNATLLSTNVYKIDGFLRGQFGTEDQIYSHGAGERFILINGAIAKTPISQSLLNVSRKGRAYTSGRPVTDFYEFDFTATGYNLLPWAPVNIKSNRGTDLLLSWTRRDRINNGWNDGVEIALNETIEQYRVDLLTNPLYLSGTIIASYFTTVPSITITASQITAAYGSSGATVHAAVRQMSSVIGAGKPLEGSF